MTDPTDQQRPNVTGRLASARGHKKYVVLCVNAGSNVSLLRPTQGESGSMEIKSQEAEVAESVEWGACAEAYVTTY